MNHLIIHRLWLHDDLPVSEIPVLVFLTETLQEIHVASSVCDFASNVSLPSLKRDGGAALSCMVWFFLRGMVLVTSGHCHVKRSLQCYFSRKRGKG